jgi:hypothetical protein
MWIFRDSGIEKIDIQFGNGNLRSKKLEFNSEGEGVAGGVPSILQNKWR